MKYFYAVVFISALWSVWGYFSSRVERTEYTVLTKKDAYEVREYPAHLVAQTTVKGEYQMALNQGFRIVAGYIFGGNKKAESIAMTAPVTETAAMSESVAMTAPVIASMEGEDHVISFGMPRSYTKETLPIPTDPRVVIVEIPTQKMAVVQYSWYATCARVAQKKDELLSLLQRDGVVPQGLVQYAGYNAPWTPPWMQRHEVMVQI